MVVRKYQGLGDLMVIWQIEVNVLSVLYTVASVSIRAGWTRDIPWDQPEKQT